MTIPEWYERYGGQANAEGWNIFDSHGSENGPWQIQRDDDMGQFPNDDAVWTYVWQRAQQGSVMHQEALEIIKEHNPQEYQSIREYVGAC